MAGVATVLFCYLCTSFMLKLYCVGFLKFWSMTFIIVTTLVMLLKHETEAVMLPDKEDDNVKDSSTQSVTEAYRQLWRIIHLPAVLSLIAALMTMKVMCAGCCHMVLNLPRILSVSSIKYIVIITVESSCAQHLMMMMKLLW